MAKLTAEADPEQLEQLQDLGPLPDGKMPLDLWIGEDGLLYKYVLDFDGTLVEQPAGEGFDRMLMTFEMFDYNTDIDLSPPPDEDVTDASEIPGFDPSIFGA